MHPPDTALSPAAAQMGEGRYFLLFPREAIGWMCRNPNARHLVPTMPARMAYSLRDNLAAAGQPNDERPANRPKSIRDLEADSKDESSEVSSSQEGAQRPSGTSQPARERARVAIKELYPDGVPCQSIEPNVYLCRRVSAKLKEAKLPHVSDDTILRAAGRRKDRKRRK